MTHQARERPAGKSSDAGLRREMAAVHAISRHLSSTLDLEDRLRDILNVSIEAVQAEAGTIYLHRPADDTLEFRYVVGPSASRSLFGMAIPASTGIAGLVFRSGEGCIINDLDAAGAHRRDFGEGIGLVTRNMVTVPLKFSMGQAVGVMQILNSNRGNFDASDLETLEIIAAIAAAAIENAHLYRRAQLAAVAHAVGDLSHDLKNKLAPIAGWVDTLRPMMDAMFDAPGGELPDADAVQAVREFYGEAFDTINQQIVDIQDYCKLIGDAIKGVVAQPRLEAHDLNAVIERQLAGLDHEAARRNVRIVRGLGAVPTALFDRSQIERAVYNLVNNALPETPEGGTITVRTAVAQDRAFGEMIVIEVADTGRGMPTDVLEGILRGEARSGKVGGTGLGTRIVANAAAAHHGRFEGESREGAGTCFRLALPLRRPGGFDQ
ncbi:MAG: ATP-binding protein [Chthonomonadales bacterium]